MLKFGVAVLVLLGGVSAFGPRNLFDTTSRKIVNGTDAAIEDIPFQVSMLRWGSQWCGGVVLNENSILTAAHCFDYVVMEYDLLSVYSIRAGSSYWAEGGSEIAYTSFHNHENYNASTADFDISIAKLASPLTYSNAIQPAVLPASGSLLAEGEYVQVSGWGRLYTNGGIPTVLQSIVMPVIDQNECVNIFDGYNDVTDRMFCAGLIDGSGDSCNGDSGGPLVRDSDKVLYGLVSWGPVGCAIEGKVGVYTTVSYFIDWINQNA